MGCKSGEKLFDFSSTKPCGTITISSSSASGYGLKSISIVSGGAGSGESTTYTGVTVSEKTPLTGNYKGDAYYSVHKL